MGARYRGGCVPSAGQQADFAEIFAGADTAEDLRPGLRPPFELHDAGADDVKRSICRPLCEKLVFGLQPICNEKICEALDLPLVETFEQHQITEQPAGGKRIARHVHVRRFTLAALVEKSRVMQL